MSESQALPQLVNIPRPPSTPAHLRSSNALGGGGGLTSASLAGAAHTRGADSKLPQQQRPSSSASNSSSTDDITPTSSPLRLAQKAAELSARSPFFQRSGKRRIDERTVAYATSLEQPIATGKRVFSSSAPPSHTDHNVGGASPLRATSGGGGVAAAVFSKSNDSTIQSERGVPDVDSSPALARKYSEALYADMRLKNVQARVAAAAALRASGKAGNGADEEELDDEGNPKPKKKKHGSMIGDYSPRKRIEDYMFLKQGKQWCPPTKHNGGIPSWESPKKKKSEEEDSGSDAPHRLTAKRQEELGERLVKPLKRDNPKKNKAPPPKPRKHPDGTEMTPAEQETYEKTLVKNLQKRLESYIETSKKAREVALKNKEKEEAKLQRPVKPLDSPAAYEKLINSLYSEPINKKRSESTARERKEAAAKEKLLHLTKKQQEDSGMRMFREGVERQRQAVAKAAERYLMRPASASPTAAYNRSRPDIESRYCPGLEASATSPRPATARGTSPPQHHVPKPPSLSARH